MLHLLPRPLPEWGKKTQVFWSTRPGDVALVFIHGFTGGALSTWGELPDMILKEAKAAPCDLFFYGYNSTTTQIGNSSLRFMNFLNWLCEVPFNLSDKFVKDETNRQSGFSYNKIVVVAHSMGAVVTRRAMLDAKSDGYSWVNKVSMVLFAPAHYGARNIGYICQKVLTGQLALLGMAVQYRFAPLEQLAPNSKMIESLETESDEWLRKCLGDFTIASSVIWAGKEHVVHNQRFCNDPKAEECPEESHTSICKPDRTFRLPINHILGAI
jgi:pimeloyl-ACP methyl ester carboxylesterase